MDGRGRQEGKSTGRTALCSACIIACLLLGCGLSVEDQVERLKGDGEEREQASQELLLAKDRAVTPLLEALEEPRHAEARLPLVEVLVSLMTRVDDERIPEALARHLSDDPDPRVRARIAQRMGMYKRKEAVGALLKALDDPEGEVRHQALLALGMLEDRLTEEGQDRLRERARTLLEDPHPGVRLEAMIRAESFIHEWIEEGRQMVLKAQMARAESLYSQALAYAPTSKQANYRLGRFYFDEGEREKGLELLYEHGMALAVGKMRRAPVVDGRLDDDVWAQAASADSFYQFVGGHTAALPAEARTRFYVGYTDRAFYVGFEAFDEHPDSLVVRTAEEDGNLWWEDIAEIYMDANFDHRSYVHLGINSRGVVSDAWHPDGLGNQDEDWDAERKVAATVGENFWSFEAEIRFRQPQLPVPGPGTIWGFNLVRVFRGSEFSQWVRTYGSSAHTPDDFGLLVFE